MTQEFISIIVPTLNSSSTLTDTLISLKKQTYPNQSYEIIVVDNGSIDNTISIAEEFDCLILNINRHNRSEARNKGIQHAKGDLIFFCDSDTILPEKMLSLVSKKFTTHRDIDVLTTSVDYYRKKGKSFSLLHRKHLVITNKTPIVLDSASFCIRKSHFSQPDIFNTKQKHSEDFFLLLDLINNQYIIYYEQSIVSKKCVTRNLFEYYLSYMKKSFYQSRGILSLTNKSNPRFSHYLSDLFCPYKFRPLDRYSPLDLLSFFLNKGSKVVASISFKNNNESRLTRREKQLEIFGKKWTLKKQYFLLMSSSQIHIFNNSRNESIDITCLFKNSKDIISEGATLRGLLKKGVLKND